MNRNPLGKEDIANMIKKILSFALILSLAICAFALAEAAVIEPIVGRIIEMQPDGFRLEPLNGGGEVNVMTDDNTENAAAWTVGKGDVVTVTYDGNMTRSMPPQITAQAIHAQSVVGEVDELDRSGNRILVETKGMGDIWFTLPEGVNAHDLDDRNVRVYFSGAVAMSFPAQAAAQAVDLIRTIDGDVVSVADDHFVIRDDGRETRINIDLHTQLNRPIEVRDDVDVYYLSESLNAQTGEIYASVVIADYDD